MNDTFSLAVSGSNVCGDVAVSCALRVGGRLRTARSPAGARDDLVALVAELSAANGVQPAQIGELRIDVGPGSYTGLRVAVTFVRMLQHFGGVSVLAVDSLTLMAARARGRTVTRVRALLDARRGRYHQGWHRIDGGVCTKLAAPSAVKLPELLASIDAGELIVLPHALAASLGPELTSRGASLLPIEAVLAEELYAPGLPLEAATWADLEPRYLMASYAED